MTIHVYKAGDEAEHQKFGRLLRELPPGDYCITIKKNKPIRSLNANKYYHATLNIIGAESGITHERLHEICKRKFNAEIVQLPRGGAEIMGRSTADMDTKEFAAYVNQVKQWAIDEFNIVIPEPQDVTYEMWMKIQNSYTKVHEGF